MGVFRCCQRPDSANVERGREVTKSSEIVISRERTPTSSTAPGQKNCHRVLSLPASPKICGSAPPAMITVCQEESLACFFDGQAHRPGRSSWLAEFKSIRHVYQASQDWLQQPQLKVRPGRDAAGDRQRLWECMGSGLNESSLVLPSSLVLSQADPGVQRHPHSTLLSFSHFLVS
jgi:hypothetical protein